MSREWGDLSVAAVVSIIGVILAFLGESCKGGICEENPRAKDGALRPINAGQKNSGGLLLTTECAITDIPEKKDAPAMPGGGMGGMGGMD